MTATAIKYPCPTCGGPTYLWDRATGERVCIDCTGFRPADSSGNRPRPAGTAVAVRTNRMEVRAA